MDRRGGFNDHDQYPRFVNTSSATTTTAVIGGILIVYLAYQVLGTLEIQDWLWNALVALIPARLLLDSATLRAQTTQDGDMYAHRHSAKSEALRKWFGSREQVLQTAIGVAQRARTLSTSGISLTSVSSPTTDVPPGLGNWDNSCYQNSVLQGLAALPSFKAYLDLLARRTPPNDMTTASSLRTTLQQLNDAKNNGRHLWTPAKLKSMSSWQQQDAQEYFSKIMDELDKEAPRLGFSDAGLQNAVLQEKPEKVVAQSKDNPLEGLLAQRVACTKCGYSEGISMIPFNCLTVPLGAALEYDVESCLDEYTGLEQIGEVDCAKCTLLRAEQQLRLLVYGSASSDTEHGGITSNVPASVREQAAQRLEAVQKALEEDDFSDKTVGQTCQISKKAHASSTKTRQAVIGRAPQSLAIHVNRSVFDERTGAQRKNYANVHFPSTLDLAPWVFENGLTGKGSSSEVDAITMASRSMLSKSSHLPGFVYRLRAIVTHYGRHENGHYIAYRQHPVSSPDTQSSDGKSKWWRLSDEDVSPMTDAEVLDQGGVFMLFYEREQIESPMMVMPAVTNVTADLTHTEKQATMIPQPDVPPILSELDSTPKAVDAQQDTATIAPHNSEGSATTSIIPAKDKPKSTSQRRKHKQSNRKDQFTIPIRPMLTI